MIINNMTEESYIDYAARLATGCFQPQPNPTSTAQSLTDVFSL